MGGRIEYCDDEDGIPQALWQQATRLAIWGKRGQALLRELETALLALPRPRLIAGAMVSGCDVCTLGALALSRERRAGETPASALQSVKDVWGDGCENVPAYEIAEAMGIRRMLGAALVELNDEECGALTPERRYEYVLAWIRERLA